MTPETAKADGQQGPRMPVRANKLQTPLLVGVAAFALAGAAVAIWYKMTHKNEPGNSDGGTHFKDVNLSLVEPVTPWALDSATKSKLGSPFIRVYKRDNPEAFMAYGAKDYDTYEPRRGELRAVLDQAMDRLLDRETFRPFEADEKQWMGQDAIGFRFRGQLKNGASVEGEAYSVSYKGIGYWFVAWTGENDSYTEQKTEFEEARKRCKLLNERTKWTPSKLTAVPYRGDTIPYTVLDGLGMWSEVNDEAQRKGEDPKADKFLIHIENPGKKNPIYKAQALIYLLDGAGDPLEAARGYIEGQENQFAEIRGKFVFKPEPSLVGDPVEDKVAGNAPYVVLRCTSAKDPELVWVYVISAIKVGDKIVAVAAKCPWEDRARFDTKFVEFVKSLN